MKFTFDPRYNIAYLKIRDKIENVESKYISEELVVDLASDGKIYGIEFLNANEQLKSEFINSITLENEATGEAAEYVFP
jgi:uncharacterized protein YuzE